MRVGWGCESCSAAAARAMESGQGNASFWEAEYAGGALGAEKFDWLFEFDDLSAERWASLLGARGRRVVIVGCGHASLSASVAKLGYETVSIDSSSTVIDSMREAHPELDWRCCDAREMVGSAVAFGSADVILDKACLDAILCYGDPSAAREAVAEYARALKVGGRLVVFACAREQQGSRGEGGADGYGGGQPRCLPLVREFFEDVTVDEFAARARRHERVLHWDVTLVGC